MYETANSFLQRRCSLALPYPVSHMAPPTPSASISVSVCGRSRQCFRSYPRNYTSVWLSAPTPGPSGRWHAVSNANRMPRSPLHHLDIHPHLFLSGPFYILSVLLTSIPQDNGQRRFLNEKKIQRLKVSGCIFEFLSRLKF